jgi:hypothetical protein
MTTWSCGGSAGHDADQPAPRPLLWLRQGHSGLKISVGGIAAMLRAAELFGSCAQTIHQTARNIPVIASDETVGARQLDGARPRRHGQSAAKPA